MEASQRLPQIAIDIDGVPLAQACAQGFVELRVHRVLSQPSLCEIAFVELRDGIVEEAFAIGASLRLAVADALLFAGRVSAIEYAYDATRGREIRVRGYDALHTLRNRQSVRTHVEVTVADLAGEFVRDLGLAVQAQSAGPVWHRLIQTRSDFDLLIDVAERCGLYLTVDDGALHLITLEGSGAPRTLRLGENLLEARFEINSHGACRAVASAAWDPWHGLPRSGSAKAARVGRRVGSEAPASLAGGKDERLTVAAMTQDDAQADALAQAELDARSSQEVALWGVALGDAELRPGARIAVSGVAERLAGEYVLSEVRHTVDSRRGFQSAISTAPVPARPRPGGATVTLGIVTQVEDPEQLGRIQATLPAYANVESDWLEVVCPGAGANKGLIALPDVGDSVVILLAESDPAQAVVLGSIFAAGGLPDGEDRVGPGASFTFLSPGGQRLRLDDAQKSLRFENSSGSFVELSPRELKLHAAAALTIEAPGQNVVIRGSAIDFQRT